MNVYNVEILAKTALALGIEGEGDELYWLPISQISFEEDAESIEIGDILEIEIPEWLAVQVELE